MHLLWMMGSARPWCTTPTTKQWHLAHLELTLGCAPQWCTSPDLAAVAPVFDVTVGQDDLALFEDDAVYEVGVANTSGGGGGLRVVRSVSRRVCIGPLTPGHEYLLGWRAVHDDESRCPCQLSGDGASRGPWSRGVRVRVAGSIGPMVDLRETWTRTRLGARWGWRGLSLGTAGDGCGCAGPIWIVWLGRVRGAECGCMAGCRGQA